MLRRDDWFFASPEKPFSRARGSLGVETSGETHVGDDADDGADENREEVPGFGGDTRGRGNAPDDEAREHGVSQGFELGALPLGRRGSLHDRRRDGRASRDHALTDRAAGYG